MLKFSKEFFGRCIRGASTIGVAYSFDGIAIITRLGYAISKGVYIIALINLE